VAADAADDEVELAGSNEVRGGHMDRQEESLRNNEPLKRTKVSKRAKDVDDDDDGSENSRLPSPGTGRGW
jgi:hypothetical protein